MGVLGPSGHWSLASSVSLSSLSQLEVITQGVLAEVSGLLSPQTQLCTSISAASGQSQHSVSVHPLCPIGLARGLCLAIRTGLPTRMPGQANLRVLPTVSLAELGWHSGNRGLEVFSRAWLKPPASFPPWAALPVTAPAARSRRPRSHTCVGMGKELPFCPIVCVPCGTRP